MYLDLEIELELDWIERFKVEVEVKVEVGRCDCFILIRYWGTREWEMGNGDSNLVM